MKKDKQFIYYSAMDLMVYRHIDHTDFGRLYGNINNVTPKTISEVFKVTKGEAESCIDWAKHYLQKIGYKNIKWEVQ